ncbi:MAG TPA: hypothetical protein DCQ83_08640 [Fibrobacteres bacterium]|jgi:hypothetical protein|nr:hypothetical protein [Fibrobacterota bacterium]
MRLPKPVLRLLSFLDRVFRILLKPLQVVSNFVFVTISYFLGVGLSAIFYRRAAKKNPQSTVDSYWQEMQTTPKDQDAWLRPF